MCKKHILHLVTKLPEKYNTKFIEFSENNLNEYRHTYVSLSSTVSENEERKIDSTNIIDLNNLGRLKKMKALIKLFLSPKYDLVIFHGLFYQGPFLLFLAGLFKFTSLAEKVLWMTWGGDIYYFQNRPNSLFGWFNEYLRKSIIKRLFFISALVEEEVALLRVNYNAKAIGFNAFYPNPTNYEIIDEEEVSSDIEYKFLVGNSADPQNNHIDMLNSLSHLKDTIKVYCILSYAIVDTNYVEEVKLVGKKLFGENFIPLEQFMVSSEYKDLINSMDFACYYHNRQQALSNIFQFLHLGKIVFLRKDTLSYSYLNRLGFNLQNSEELSSLSISKLKELKIIGLNNRIENKKYIEKYFSDDAAVIKWQQTLDKIFSFLKKS
ncbi:TDP-N-acetylfucosamine:lipid II N-acetylfucosaminyltransferase [Pseudoalteromonas denitrificans]|uniref:4-alpha-L-fucosyltransferase glycosyl transferase group 56 n=1 Tax=Pseudoalteromonas denitrificans DSM 6059 TaxID=1123010 RepID=A0A1I1JTW0_9GAMM|nr:TDP-N-acetylfucosamine:lipid II N-acetylfucosaminyltransferase [Pseudoalteromonas denitrificans]SFC52079.1 4-alpha-L-fucosyltransferase glycosyl transferase group 56 [Pseudoalteromonas denitrificans DSM 6059]